MTLNDPNNLNQPLIRPPSQRKIPFTKLLGVFIVAFIAVGVIIGITWQSNKLITQTQDTRSQAASTSVPSVVVFMLDDLDVDLLQQMVTAGKMPNLKNLIIDKGTTFTNAFVNRSVCCTSRATFLTGKYAHNHGVWNVDGPPSQSPDRFRDYLTETGNAYLPTWLKAKNYRNVFIGKWHLGYANPPHPDIATGDGIELNGYDLRPGAYKAVVWGESTTQPLVYQTKYLGDTAKSKLVGSTNPIFAYLAPNAVHTAVNVFSDRRVDTLSGLTNKKVVATTEFRHYQDNVWNQHIVTENNGNYEWWLRTGGLGTGPASTPAYSGTFTNIGDQVTSIISGKTLVGWNVYPTPTENVQQAVLQEGTTYYFYSRKVSGGVTTPWEYNGDSTSVLAGTATSLPLVGWAVIRYPDGAIRQQILQGGPEVGFKSFVRYRTNTGTFSAWVEDAYWGDIVGFYQPVGFNLSPYGPAGNLAKAQYQIVLTTLNPAGNPRNYYSTALPDFYQINNLGNPPMLADDSADSFASESGIYAADYMQYSPLQFTPSKSASIAGVTSAQTQLHPYFIMRAPAEGSWYPIGAGQTYDWGGNYPAGSLRTGGDDHTASYLAAFKPVSLTKPSYNLPLSGTVPTWYESSWPSLTTTIWGATTNGTMLTRLTLDRMEQLMSVDKMVGEVVNHALNVNSNTLFIFTSDNGHFNGEHRLGNKYTPHEESIKVPLYIRAPGQTTGKQVNHLVSNADIAPTILDYAGIAWGDKVDGRSLKPLVESTSVAWRNALLIQHKRPDPNAAASVTDWAYGLPAFKALRVITSTLNELYVHYQDPKTPDYYERYLMNTDKYQTNNVATSAVTTYETAMNNLASCKGATCRTYDVINAVTPTSTSKPDCQGVEISNISSVCNENGYQASVSWDAVAEASEYYVAFDDDNQFWGDNPEVGELVSGAFTTQTSKNISFTTDKTRYFRVRITKSTACTPQNWLYGSTKIINGPTCAAPGEDRLPTSKKITISAKGVYANNAWPTVEVHLKNKKGTYQFAKSFTIDTSSYKNYVYTHTTAFDASKVRLKYVNDNGPRDVYINYIKVGATTYQTEAATTYSTGTWNSTTQKCSPRYAASEGLHCNGYFDYLK